MHALKVNGDDPDQAGHWLQGPQAVAYLRSQIGGSDGDDTERWQTARQLANDFGMPPLLCWHALRLNEDNRERAVNWSYDPNGGQRYMAQMISADEMESKKTKNAPPNPEAVAFCTMMGFTEDDAVLALSQPGISGAESAINWLMDTSDEEKDRLRVARLEEVIAESEGESNSSTTHSTNELDDKSALEEIGQAEDIMGGSIGNIRDSEATVGNSDDSNDFGRSNQPEYNYKKMNMIKNGLLVMITNRSNGNSFDEEQAIVGVIKSSTNDLVTLCYTDESGF